ncbi:hypothetical protein ACB092_01G114200 [Castanea dentata]
MKNMLEHDQKHLSHIYFHTKALEEGLQDNDEGVPVSIFSVPKTLLSFKPEAYIPQLVALGPYHHHWLELLEMERYKLTSTMRLQKNLKEIKLRDLVNQIAESDSCICACYHRFLEFYQETLSWMLSIDAMMLPSCWNSLMQITSKMAHLIDHTHRKTPDHAVLRDIIMLENQISLFLLREVHSFYPCEDHGEELATMLIGFCKHLSPIECINEQHFKEVCFTKSHLLELLYYMVAPKLQLVADNSEQEKPKEDKEIGYFQSILNALCYINLATLRLLIKIFNSKAVKLLVTLPFIIISYLFNLKYKSDITKLILSAEAVAKDAQSASNEMKDESPLVEEIAIPSVTQLHHKNGVKFRPSKGGLGTINFDRCSGTFYLPVIHLDGNSEVVLRNLIAYEACIAPDVMVFTRYTELMNGINDTEEDVKILREAGIILNRLKSDEESVRVTKVPILDKAIEAANACYSGCWRNKMTGFMKKYIFGSWPCLTFLAANILILLSTLQAACSMYNCSKLLATL